MNYYVYAIAWGFSAVNSCVKYILFTLSSMSEPNKNEFKKNHKRDVFVGRTERGECFLPEYLSIVHQVLQKIRNWVFFILLVIHKNTITMTWPKSLLRRY